MFIKTIYKKTLHINLNHVNSDFLIYNGKSFYKLIISKEMIGRRFGEFVVTRKFFKFKKKNLNKK